jgi:hypothetical protein
MSIEGEYVKKFIYLKSIFIIFTALIVGVLLAAVIAAAETQYTNETSFQILYGTSQSTLTFDTLIDGSDEATALAAEQIKHPTRVGFFLIHSITTGDLIDVWGFAFSDDWTFNSAAGAGTNIKRIVRWQDETIEILDGYSFMEVISPDDSVFALVNEDNDFVGVAPDSDETVFYVANPGRVMTIKYNYDLEGIAAATWQGSAATWQGVPTLW